MDVPFLKLLAALLALLLLSLVVILALPSSQSGLVPETTTTDQGTSSGSGETEGLVCAETEYLDSEYGKCRARFQEQTLWTSLPSVNECEGEFVSKELDLGGQYKGLEKATARSNRCVAALQAGGLVVLRVELAAGYTRDSDPAAYAAPEGYRYLYYDELLAADNAALISRINTNLEEQNNDGAKVGLVNGWIDGSSFEKQCGKEASAPYYSHLIMISECYPLME
uniref:Uncharacterized protein n=1 Tax=Strombidium rassoulzadegani TaxID=1082188 RepID=A0A7S3CT04_9SPIT|mmetsp:Transcript_731/g.1338  ORF Transcript_731/g.1338 Transcript_731/m.1338 type:complete len:225 (+) Transcript_731:156-830(+)